MKPQLSSYLELRLISLPYCNSHDTIEIISNKVFLILSTSIRMIFLLHVKKGGFPGSGTQIPFSKKSSILVGHLPSSPGLRSTCSQFKVLDRSNRLAWTRLSFQALDTRWWKEGQFPWTEIKQVFPENRKN